MNRSTLRALSIGAGFLAIFGVLMIGYAMFTDTSLAGGSATTLIGIVLFFALRHASTRDDKNAR